jgi:hypothetical protein
VQIVAGQFFHFIRRKAMKASRFGRVGLWAGLMGVVIGMAAIAAQAQVAMGGQRGGPAAATATMTDRQACRIEKDTFPLNVGQQVHFVKDGLLLDVGRHKQVTLEYADMKRIVFSPGVFFHADIYIQMIKKHGSYDFSFMLTVASNDKVQTLVNAINTMIADAEQGKTVVCSDDAQDYADELAAFEQQTTAWRALVTKPPLSDEAYKDRLLAEDALKSRNLDASAGYYEAGVAAEPTWDQGWYNLALLYAEQNDYFDAAQCMKHYVILMPDAPDAREAKDNIILWEAKAPLPAQTSGAGGQPGGGALRGGGKSK